MSEQPRAQREGSRWRRQVCGSSAVAQAQGSLCRVRHSCVWGQERAGDCGPPSWDSLGPDSQSEGHHLRDGLASYSNSHFMAMWTLRLAVDTVSASVHRRGIWVIPSSILEATPILRRYQSPQEGS